VAPELALGVLDGDERAEALRHLATCAECRAYTDQLASVADSLLLLAPTADPPLGFESRVVAAVTGARPRPHTWLRTAAVAVAAAVVAVVATAAVVAGGDDDSLVRATLASSKSGEVVGRVWTYDAAGGRDWMFMTIDNPWAADNPYVCEAVLRDGRVVRLGRFVANDGKGAWGEPVAVAVHDVAVVRVLTEDGDIVASAPLGD
jgi:hypothetical protein